MVTMQRARKTVPQSWLSGVLGRKGEALNGMPQLPKALMRLNKAINIAAVVRASIDLLAGEHHFQCSQQMVSHLIIGLITGLMEG